MPHIYLDMANMIFKRPRKDRLPENSNEDYQAKLVPQQWTETQCPVNLIDLVDWLSNVLWILFLHYT